MAEKAKIASLTLDRFRGASQRSTISFSDKPITILFGENGSGKSSVIDGLEFVLRGVPGSISDISGASPGTHLPTINSKTRDVFAELQLSDNTLLSATISGNKIAQKAGGSSECPRVLVLRRSRILQLVTAQAAKRYEALASFIEVGDVETAEESLAKVINDEGKTLEATRVRVRNSTEELERLFAEHAAPDERSVGFELWAAQQADRDIKQLTDTVDSVERFINNHASLDGTSTEVHEQQATLDVKRKDQKEAREAFVEAVKAAPDAVDLLIDLLNAGKKYIDAVQEIMNCPLCSNVTTRASLIVEIETKLNALPAVQAAKKVRDDADESVRLATQALWPLYVRFLQAAHSLLIATEKLPEEYRNGLGSMDTEFALLRTLPQVVAQKDVTKERNESAIRLLARAAEILPKCKAEYAKQAPRKTLFSSIQNHYKSLVKGRRETRSAEKDIEHLKAMLNVLRPIRQRFVAGILDSIASSCDALYAEIHPDEPYGKIRLILDAEKRASCELTAEFCGRTNIPPQAYYSESHMDTLGFALFIALAKREDSRDCVLVLDDVFTSVDDQHLDRICHLLTKEANSFRQIILATHIRKILDWTRYGHLPQNICGLVHLSSRWSLEKGIHSRLETIDREEIEKLVEDNFLDRTTLAAKTRRFMEAILGNMVINLEGRAQMKKFGDYDLGDYLSGLASIAKKGLRVVRTSSLPGTPLKLAGKTSSMLGTSRPNLRESYDLKAKAKEFAETKSVVNRLVHASDEGGDYTDEELRIFAREALDLEEYLRCNNRGCGSLVGIIQGDINNCA